MRGVMCGEDAEVLRREMLREKNRISIPALKLHLALRLEFVIPFVSDRPIANGELGHTDCKSAR